MQVSSVPRSTPAAVLVVDDDQDFRETVCATLQDEGIQAVGMANGRRALEWLADHDAQLILLDLVMPEMNGWELQKSLASNPDLSRVPILIMSDQASNGVVASKNGITFTMRKPFRIQDLLTYVDRYVRTH